MAASLNMRLDCGFHENIKYTNKSAFKIHVWPIDLKYSSGYTQTLDRNFKTYLKDRGKRDYIMLIL